MNENGNGTETEFELPPRQVASLEEVSEDRRALYVKSGNGYRLRPQMAAEVDRMERELQIAETEHRCEMLELEKQLLTEKCSRLQREVAQAAGRPPPQAEPPEPENSFSAQLARLKDGLFH